MATRRRGTRGRHRAEGTANGADEVIDHTSTEVTAAVAEPVDVLLNLAPIDPHQFTALVALVGDGGVVVSTTVHEQAAAGTLAGKVVLVPIAD